MLTSSDFTFSQRTQDGRVVYLYNQSSLGWDKKGDRLMALQEFSYNVGFYQKALLEEFLAALHA